MVRMMLRTYPILLAFAILLAGCGCEQRLQRLKRDCPDCFKTAVVRDTIINRAIVFDTVAPLGEYTDGERGLTIQRREFDLRIMLNDDSVKVELETKPDTVVIDRLVEIPAEPCKTSPPWAERIIILALVILIVTLLRLLLLRR